MFSYSIEKPYSWKDIEYETYIKCKTNLGNIKPYVLKYKNDSDLKIENGYLLINTSIKNIDEIINYKLYVNYSYSRTKVNPLNTSDTDVGLIWNTHETIVRKSSKSIYNFGCMGSTYINKLVDLQIIFPIKADEYIDETIETIESVIEIIEPVIEPVIEMIEAIVLPQSKNLNQHIPKSIISDLTNSDDILNNIFSYLDDKPYRCFAGGWSSIIPTI